jgi:hypothetical protein
VRGRGLLEARAKERFERQMARHRAEQAAREAEVASPAASHRFHRSKVRGPGPPVAQKRPVLYTWPRRRAAPRFLVVKNREEHIFARAEAVELHDTDPANVNDCATRIEAI